MAIDYSLFAIPKQRVKALDKADARKALEAKDKAESAKAKKRAKGRCEVHFAEPYGKNLTRWVGLFCSSKDTETHHLIGGIGRRNKGKSILADYKLRVCKECHAAITANILRPTTAEHTAATVRFWRAK
jgi:hypothetical protein